MTNGIPFAQKVAPKQGDLARAILERYAPDGTAAGTRLPTERRLAEEFLVSRTAIRHALGQLEADGRISREVGRGTFVLDPRSDAKPLGVNEANSHRDDLGPVDVIAARRVIEVGVIPLVVSRATERDFREIERCQAGCDNAASGDEYKAWDLALHRAIAQATHNPLMIRLNAEVEIARQGRMWDSIQRRADSVSRREELQKEHAAIVAALLLRDIDAAERAVLEHIDNNEKNMLRSLRQARVS